MKKENLYIILTIISILIVSILGSIFVNLGMEWYSQLKTPNEWIPNFIIPIVWTIIYIAFAIILSILFKQNLMNKTTITLSIINGILNVIWCLTFFALNQLLLGNILIILNSFFATLLLANLIKIDKWYINILWIYPVWTFIATTFNLALWILN